MYYHLLRVQIPYHKAGLETYCLVSLNDVRKVYYEVHFMRQLSRLKYNDLKKNIFLSFLYLF